MVLRDVKPKNLRSPDEPLSFRFETMMAFARIINVLLFSCRINLS